MGTVQIPSTQTQPYSPQPLRLPSRNYAGQAAAGQAARRPLELGMQAASVLGSALSNAGQTALGMGQVGMQILEKRRARQVQEGLAAYREFRTTQMINLSQNPTSTEVDEQGNERTVYRTYERWSEARGEFLDTMRERLTAPGARDRLMAILDEDEQKIREQLVMQDFKQEQILGYDQYAETFTQAVEQGNLDVAVAATEQALADNLITPKMYDDNLDRAYTKAARDRSLMYARSLGFEDGLRWLADSSHLEFQTHDGQDRRLSPQIQSELVEQLKQEWRIAQEQALREKRNQWYATDDALWRRFAEGNLTQDDVLGIGIEQFEGQPGDLQAEWLQRLRQHAGGDGDQVPEAYQTHATMILTDPYMTKEQKYWQLRNLLADSYPDAMADYLRKVESHHETYRSPIINEGLQEITELYDATIAGAKRDQRAELTEQKGQAIENFLTYVQTVDPNQHRAEIEARIQEYKERVLSQQTFGPIDQGDVRERFIQFSPDVFDEMIAHASGEHTQGLDVLAAGPVLEQMHEGIRMRLSEAFGRDYDRVEISRDGRTVTTDGTLELADGRMAYVYDNKLYTLETDPNNIRRQRVVKWTGSGWVPAQPSSSEVSEPEPIEETVDEAITRGGRGGTARIYPSGRPENTDFPEMSVEDLEAALARERNKHVRSRNYARIQRIQQELERRGAR